MTILAFRQNQWFHNPAKVERLMQVYPQNRESMIRYALFAGCLTGRRLKAAFGEELCDQIIWEEASPVISGHASDCPPADPQHMAAVITKHRPDVILVFGTIAGDGIKQISSGAFDRSLPISVRIIAGPHPAARGSQTHLALDHMAEHLRCITDSLQEATR